MAVLFTVPHGVGTCGGLLERGLAGLGGPIRRDRQASPRCNFQTRPAVTWAVTESDGASVATPEFQPQLIRGASS